MTLQATNPANGEPGPGVVGLDVVFRHVGQVSILALTGDLERGSVAILEAEVDRLGRTPCKQVVLDLGRLDGVDETGCRVLTGLHHYIAARGGRLTVVGASRSVGAALAGTPLAPSTPS